MWVVSFILGVYVGVAIMCLLEASKDDNDD